MKKQRERVLGAVEAWLDELLTGTYEAPEESFEEGDPCAGPPPLKQPRKFAWVNLGVACVVCVVCAAITASVWFSVSEVSNTRAPSVAAVTVIKVREVTDSEEVRRVFERSALDALLSGRPQKAVSDCHAAMRRGSTGCHLTLALAYKRLGDVERACDHFWYVADEDHSSLTGLNEMDALGCFSRELVLAAEE